MSDGTKKTDPKDKGLENDILNEGAKAKQGNVDQSKVKEGAEKLGDGKQPKVEGDDGGKVEGTEENTTGKPQAGTQEKGTGLPPAKSTLGSLDEEQEEEMLKDLRNAKDFPKEGLPIPGEESATSEELIEFLEFRKQKRQQAQQLEEQKKAQEEEDKDAPAIHKKRVAKYGEGYVVATRKGVEQIFKKTAWERLGGDQNKDGLRRVVKTPPEVAKVK